VPAPHFTFIFLCLRRDFHLAHHSARTVRVIEGSIERLIEAIRSRSNFVGYHQESAIQTLVT